MGWLWSLFVEMPAQVIGGLGNMGINLAILMVTLVAAIGAGLFVDRNARLPDAARRGLAIAVGVIAFAYVGIVLWEARHVLVVTLIQQQYETSDD